MGVGYTPQCAFMADFRQYPALLHSSCNYLEIVPLGANSGANFQRPNRLPLVNSTLRGTVAVTAR